MSASDEQRRNIRERLGVTEKPIDPLFFSQECSDARICLRTGPVCMCGIEKMQERMRKLEAVAEAARWFLVPPSECDETLSQLELNLAAALAALEDKS